MVEEITIVGKVNRDLKFEEGWSCCFETWKKLIFDSHVGSGVLYVHSDSCRGAEF